jgi:hypothetical protein
MGRRLGSGGAAAVLAARTGAAILPFWVIRTDGRHLTEVGGTITLASDEPAELARATQEIATAIEAGIRLAPEQWCVYKPMWPDDPGEIARLESLGGTAPEAFWSPVGPGGTGSAPAGAAVPEA